MLSIRVLLLPTKKLLNIYIFCCILHKKKKTFFGGIVFNKYILKLCVWNAFYNLRNHYKKSHNIYFWGRRTIQKNLSFLLDQKKKKISKVILYWDIVCFLWWNCKFSIICKQNTPHIQHFYSYLWWCLYIKNKKLCNLKKIHFPKKKFNVRLK